MNYSNIYARIYNFRVAIAKNFKQLFSIPAVKIYVIFLVFLQISAWVQAILIRRKISDDFLVLHYNIDFGVDLVGRANDIFYYPFLGLLVFILNLTLAAFFSRRPQAKITTHLFLAATLIFGSFLSLVLVAINLINFR
ncbi:MAG: hypothetical protein ACOX0H_02415 [Patescibacteria group bacterium]|jgi:hypothetical protein|nr:hypothetical protein [bacterium]HQC49718.1 hypothetical protein [bacterium]